MTTQSPFEWITAHINKGVHLREEVHALTTVDEGEAWAARARAWLQEAREGVAARSREDIGRLDVIGTLPLPWPPLSPGNPFYEAYEYVGLATSSTGVGRPGNNPANWHAGHVARLEEIAKDWRAKAPLSPRRRAAAAHKGELPSSLAEKQCREWLTEKLKARRTETKPVIEDEVFADDTFPMFPGLKGKGFDRAWKDAIKAPTTHESRRRRGPVNSSCRGV